MSMIVIQKDVVEAVQNQDGVFEQVGPDYDLSFDFCDSPRFATGGVIEIEYAEKVLEWAFGIGMPENEIVFLPSLIGLSTK